MTSAFKHVTNENVRGLKNAVQNLNTDKKSAVSISRFFFYFFPLVTIIIIIFIYLFIYLLNKSTLQYLQLCS